MAELFSILEYVFDKQTAPNLGDTFQTVASVTIPNAPAGTYLLAYAFEADFNGSKNNPMYFRMGGTFGSATEFSARSEADADKKNRYYAFSKDFAGGDLVVSLDMRKDAGIGTLDIDFVDVMIMRVG